MANVGEDERTREMTLRLADPSDEVRQDGMLICTRFSRPPGASKGRWWVKG